MNGDGVIIPIIGIIGSIIALVYAFFRLLDGKNTEISSLRSAVDKIILDNKYICDRLSEHNEQILLDNRKLVEDNRELIAKYEQKSAEYGKEMSQQRELFMKQLNKFNDVQNKLSNEIVGMGKDIEFIKERVSK